MTRVVTNELFFKFDDGRVNFDGEGSEALIAFVKAEQLPLVNEFSDMLDSIAVAYAHLRRVHNQ